MSEKRSMTESQKPPNFVSALSSRATLPSMKSKMLATIMMTPAVTNRPWPSASAAATLMRTPTNVRMFGMDPQRHARAMITRSGNMQIWPMRPVKVMDEAGDPRCGGRYNERFKPRKNAVYCMPIQDLKAQIARLPEQPGVYLYFNGAGETLYVGKAKVLRDRVRVLPRRARHQPPNRCAPRRGAAPRSHRHRLGGRGAGAREPPDQAAGPRVQHPAARRQELPLPAADDRRGLSARAGRPAGRAGRPLLRRPVPARVAGAPDDVADAQAVRDPVVQRGDHRRARPRPCLEYDIKRCVAPCVREICGQDEYRVAVEHTQLFLEGRNDELLPTLKDRMAAAPATSGSSRRRSCATRSARSRRCRRGSRRWRAPELGDRDAFGVKLGPAGAVVQIFQVRGGKVVERVELVDRRRRADRRARRCRTRPSDAPGGAAAVLCRSRRAAGGAPAGRVRAKPTPRCSRAGSSAGGRAARADRRPEARREARPAGARGAQRRSRLPGALQRERRRQLRRARNAPRRARPAGAVPRRIECFDISTIQGSETVASMVVCEDGRMKRSEYRKFRIGADGRGSGLGGSALGTRPWADWARDSRRLRAMHEVVLRRYRKVLEHGGPFPDLILIDGGKGQLSARLPGARGARAREPGGGRHREEGGAALHARPRRRRSRCRRTARRCC